MRNTCHHTWLCKGFLGIWTQDLMLDHQGVYWLICLPSHDFIVILWVTVTDAVHYRLKCWCCFYKREFSVAVKHVVVKWKPLLGILSWARALLGVSIAESMTEEDAGWNLGVCILWHLKGQWMWRSDHHSIKLDGRTPKFLTASNLFWWIQLGRRAAILLWGPGTLMLYTCVMDPSLVDRLRVTNATESTE